MTCGKCKNCNPLYVCGSDCECKAKAIEVAQDDDIRFYGERNAPCECFEQA